MAKKKLEVFININNEKEFNYILNHNSNRLIYSVSAVKALHYAGQTLLGRLRTPLRTIWRTLRYLCSLFPLIFFTKSQVLADEIQSLKRFQNQSQPVFMFILNKKITRVFRGVDNIRFAEVARQELLYFKQELEGEAVERRKYDINEPSEQDMEWHRIRQTIAQQEANAAALRVSNRQAARKKHRAELMVPYLQHLNFVLYWPHAKHGHPELYERWDMNNIIMVGREEIKLTKEMAEDVLYAGDASINEASMYTLLSGPALAICFRLLDTDKHFVSLVRRILYEELPPLDDSKLINEQLPQKTAFDLYKTYSLSREEIWEKRREERLLQQKQEIERRARRLSEMQRLARQAILDELEARKAEKERRKLELLKSGDLDELEKLRSEPDNFETDIVVPEALSDEEEQVNVIEDETEYLPPAGLLIPGFYSPPNDIAKVNGLAVLFPKIVAENVIPEEEFLPPHVLVMLDISKSQKAIKALGKYKDLILHMGIFKATTPYNSKHIAYSVKQFKKLELSYQPEELKLVFMVSMENDLAALELMDMNPVHVSRNCEVGEEECAAMFPVDYGDEYPEFEDFDSDEHYEK